MLQKTETRRTDETHKQHDHYKTKRRFVYKIKFKKKNFM